MKKAAVDSTPRTLQATIEQSGDSLSVRWEFDEEDGKIWQSYKIKLDEIQRSSDEILDGLRRLEAIDWSDPTGAALQPCLRKLVKAGKRQYEVLMTGDGRTAEFAKEFREWFESEVAPNSANWRVQVVHHQYNSPLICWGLTFTPLQSKDSDALGTDWEDYQNFWSISLKLACRGILLKRADQMQLRLGDYETKVPVTVEVSDELINQYEQAVGEAEHFSVREQISNTVKSFEKTSERNELQNVFWYVFLGQEDNALVIDDDELTSNSIRKARDNISKVFVMFLDGHSVIRGKRGTRWVETLLDKGRTGLISTEVDINNQDLVYFGWEFLKFVLARPEDDAIPNSKTKPLIEAIHEARKEFWPKSLLYGVYCDPLHIFFQPPPEGEIKAADDFLTGAMGHNN